MVVTLLEEPRFLEATVDVLRGAGRAGGVLERMHRCIFWAVFRREQNRVAKSNGDYDILNDESSTFL